MNENLKQYNQKRDFEKTNEPRGKKQKQSKQLIFVVQHHLARRDHYDFRLEWDGVLLSWAVPNGPSFNPIDKRLAVHVEDHPLDYQHFEGTIPKGQYGGGTVMLWDNGFYIPDGDMGKGLKDGSLKFTLHGQRLKGAWSLVKMKKKENEDYWFLRKLDDSFAKKTSGVNTFTRSIETNRTMKEIAAEKSIKTTNPFKETDLQLAQLMNSVPEGDDWLYEIKYDGYRILSYVANNEAKLVSRNGKNYNKDFQEIASSLIELASGRSMVLDGEIVVIDKTGKTDFQSLQNHRNNSNSSSLSYMIFDLLAIDGQDLRKKTLLERKEKLRDLLQCKKSNLFYSAHVKGNGQENFAAVEKAGLEGLICKKADSQYLGKRNGDWVKVKCDNRQEFIICGYILSQKITGGIKSLILGYYQNKELIYAGKVGTGFNSRTMKELIQKLSLIKKKKPVFDNVGDVKEQKAIIWVAPKYVAEIKFSEWTKDNVLRHPSFIGLRIDKRIDEVVKETVQTKAAKRDKKQIANSKTEISNKDKIMFENTSITKEDVANYYQKVASRMLPYLHNHLLSLIVCPNGNKGGSFFKKHPMEQIKNTFVVVNKDMKKAEYLYINKEDELLFQVQMNAVEFHLWGSSIKNIEKPDVIVFDLDPDEGVDLAQVQQGARDLKKILTSLNLVSFLKTSGGKGYHIVVPLTPKGDWEKIRTFCKNVALLMETKWPDKYTSNVRKNKRVQKIFIDWMRNNKGATSISPYSLRARSGAPVSMPIKWSELSKIAPNQIKLDEIIKRLKKQDPWKDFFEIGKIQSIK